jgi:CheY-like chemotaxis protein
VDAGTVTPGGPEAGCILAARRVLVADASAQTLKLMTRILSSMGAAQVLGASDGEEALQLYRAAAAERGGGGDAPVDIVITDCDMPRLDGPGLAERLRVLGFPGAILGVTGHSLDSDRQRMQAAGASAVLVKPITRAKLAAVLKELLAPPSLPGLCGEWLQHDPQQRLGSPLGPHVRT